MKTLQNDFTTPEQSKRLLELGVPADSADCIYVKHVMNSDYDLEIMKERSYSEEVSEFEGFYDYIPCWSVGRLIVIYAICTGVEYIGLPTDDDFIDTMMIAIERDDLNLSKLED